MNRLSPRSSGLAFAGIGSLFAVIGAGMLLVQFLITGEWLFEGEVNGKQVGEKPVGVEFASIFLAFGLAFVFLGTAQATSARLRVVLHGLAAAQFVLIPLAFGATVLGTFDQDVGLLLLLVWPLILFLGAALATLHPTYKHGAAMEQLGIAADHRAAEHGATTFRSTEIPPVSEQSQVPPDAAPAGTQPFFPSGSVRRALIVSAITALFPILFFSFFLIAVVPNKDPGMIAFFGIFMIVAAMFFGVPTFVFVLMAQTLASRGSKGFTQGYHDFAARVGGEVITQQIPFLGLTVPKAVLIPTGKHPCVLDLESVGSGENRVTFTRVTFELPSPAGLECQVTPQGLLEGLGSFLGIQDVQLGWEVFDDQFVVKTSDETLVRQILDQPAQEMLLALRQLSYRIGSGSYVGSGHADLLIRDSRVQMRLRAAPTSEQDLLACYQGCLDLFEHIAPRLRTARPAIRGASDDWG